jgi:hypothetical protein
MRAQLEAIAQILAQEIETTGTITLDGHAMLKNSLNPSNYASLCRPAVDKSADMIKDAIPKSRIDRVAFTTAGESAWERSRHVVAEVTTEEGVFTVDPTIRQYLPDAAMVYSEDEPYPLGIYPHFKIITNLYDGLQD